MRILAITQSKDIIGGANRSFLDVLDALRNLYHHDVIVLSPGEGDFTDELQRMGVEYICADYRQVSFVRMGDLKDPVRYLIAALNDIYNLKNACALSKQLNNKGIDIIYINDTTNTIGYYLSKKLRTPYVWHFRGYHSSIRKYMLCERKFRKSNRGIVIAISNAMKDYMVKYRRILLQNIKVIYNGVVNAGVEIRQPWEKSIVDGLHCVHCGHLSEAKGQLESIRAIAILRERGYKNIYLHLAGSPLISHGKSYKDVLENEVFKYSLQDQVIFEGEVKNMGMLREKMQIELMCSVAEPFGRVTVEGMQAGLVVIGCDTGATPEIIQDKINGLIYHRGNVVELADRIEQVYNNHELGNLLSSAAIHTTMSKFTMEENVRQINEVLVQMRK